MNKQQLANKIWESANKMRSKIEANEYKDYILGFIFYKFLSDKEVDFLKKDGYEETDLQEHVHENNEELVDYCQQHLGYFIAYDNLFSTWLDKGNSFTVDNVRTALSAFNRLISDTQKKVFSKIFNTLETGLSKLGDSTSNQTKAIRDLIQLIKDIPTDGRQDYDVLGFIYEYLISNFAANAGKKAGEFYTPHEVSQLMSEIVANHLKDREKIEIYDPTSGSGSLLITIGKSAAKYLKNKDSIMYYAQELKENTYNLTRMNLVMRGINPANIFTRCGDTLEQDWPMYDDVTQTYNPLYLDAVVSNPPYSQHWDPSHKETDPRYRYGMAPKGKADYAFLLHDLYHVKPDGTRRNRAGSRASRVDRRSTFGYGTNHFDTDPANKTDAGDAKRDGRTTQEGPPHDTESAGGDEKTPAGERRTGWEDTRPSLTADGKIRFAGRGNLVASSASHMSSGHSRLALGGLSGLASAVSIIGNGDPDESEEAKKERESRENGSALGALIGTAIGAVTAINARCSNENTQEGQAPDIVQTPDIGEDEGESEHPFELSM